MGLDLGGYSASSESEAFRESLRSRVKVRPTAVTVIAGLQFLRCWVILLFMLAILVAPEAEIATNPAMRTAFWVMAHKTLPSAALAPILMPILAVITGVIGWGLWNLKVWARRSLMLTTGLTVAYWGRSMLIGWVLAGGDTAAMPAQKEGMGIVILVDAMIFAYLWVHAESFGIKD